MRSPATRFILGAVALLTLGAAGYYAFLIEQQASSVRAAGRAFDLAARDAVSSLGELGVTQLGYVATDKDISVLIARVKEQSEDIRKDIAALRADATVEDSRTALGNASETMVEFGNVDQRARDYLTSGQGLMAGDVISTEGVTGAADAAHQIDLARAAELKAVETAEAGFRRRQVQALAGAGGVTAVVLLLFMFVTPRQNADAALTEVGTGSLSLAHAAAAEPSAQSPGSDHVVLREAPASTTYVTARPAGPVLRAASKLCTDLGRVSDLDELKVLIGQAADVMDATGIVIWIAAADGTYVQPAISHGYPPEVMARMSRVLRSADNAAAAAYRSGQMQIVLARPGESNGAVVAPLLSVDGCIGALSAEIRGGGESSESVQALAAIFAAQLAGVLNTTNPAAVQEPRATGTI